MAQLREPTIEFGRHSADTAPEGFDFLKSGNGQPGKWRVVHDASIGGSAIEQLNSDRTAADRHLLAIYRSLSIRNTAVGVRVRPMHGRLDLAGGIAVRMLTPNDYYAVVVDAYDDDVAFFKVRNGNYQIIARAMADISSLQWRTLDLVVEENRFRVDLDGKWQFTAFDSTFETGRSAC
jgi:hypothetical protein